MRDKNAPDAILRDWTRQAEQQYDAAKDAIAERIERLDWTVLPDYWQAQYKYLIAAVIRAALDRATAPDPLTTLSEAEADLRDRLLNGHLREQSTAAVSRAQAESNEDAARALLCTDFPRLRARIEHTAEMPQHA